MIKELSPPAVLNTNRTVLRKYVPEDVHIILHMLKRNNLRLKDHFPITVSMVISEDAALDFIFLRSTEWEQDISFTYGIFDKISNEYIGQVTIKKIEWDKKEAELGYFLDETQEGKGLMSEVLSEIEYQCIKLGFKNLFLRILPGNNKSIKLAESFGYKNIRTLKENIQNTEGGMSDIWLYMKEL